MASAKLEMAHACNTRESLAGRADRLRLHFSLSELLRKENPPNPLAARSLSDQIFTRQVIHGGYHAIYLAQSEPDRVRLLSDLSEALFLRDASDLFRIKRVDVFRKLLTLLAGQTGNLVNFSEIASICHVDAATIHAYVEILEGSHIVKVVRPFAGGKRRELTTSPKIYFRPERQPRTGHGGSCRPAPGGLAWIDLTHRAFLFEQSLNAF